jgi:hypothetical protein
MNYFSFWAHESELEVTGFQLTLRTMRVSLFTYPYDLLMTVCIQKPVCIVKEWRYTITGTHKRAVLFSRLHNHRQPVSEFH